MLLAQENSTISPQLKHPEAELLSRQEKREREREREKYLKVASLPVENTICNSQRVRRIVLLLLP